MWQNFTTYFNTYFNASKAFEEAQTQLLKDQKEMFAFKVDKLNGSAKKQFDLVVEKCSRILQFDSQSSYVAGSLFMIGRAFYYQKEFPKASRKFKELNNLNDDDYSLKSLLWIGKTELQLRNFNSGMAILDSVKEQAATEEDEELLVKAYRSQIAYYLFNEDYNIVVDLITKLVAASENEEINAEATYELGKIYLKLDSLDKAADAFLAVDQYSPTFETDFNSKLEFATIKRKVGKIDESLSILEDMESRNKYVKKRDKIELQIANIYRDRGSIDDAISKYMEIDSTYKRTESAGYASYNIAKILEDSLKLYDSAMVFFDKTLSSSVPKEFKTKAKRESNVLSKYLDLSDKQINYEQQLTYVLNPGVFVQDSLDYEFYMGHDTSTVVKKNLNDSTKVDSTAISQSTQNKNNQTTNFLSDYQNQNKKKIKKPVRPRISADSVIHSLSRIRYSLGNMFLGDLDVPDSAYYYYKLIQTEDPDGPYMAKASFALGSFYSSQNDSVKADSLYKLVYDNYKSDPIAIEAARRLGHVETNVASDTTEAMYIEAENTYMSGNYKEAISKFYKIADNYPKSRMAPKSLYAIGWLLESKLDLPDSAFAVYTKLHKKYRRSEYTLAITPQINVYNNELKKIAKAIKDSINKVRRDSIALAAKDSLRARAVRDSLITLKLQEQNSVNTKVDSLGEKSQSPLKQKNTIIDSTKPEQIKNKLLNVPLNNNKSPKDTSHVSNSK